MTSVDGQRWFEVQWDEGDKDTYFVGTKNVDTAILDSGPCGNVSKDGLLKKLLHTAKIVC